MINNACCVGGPEAHADGCISEFEERDLQSVAKLLCLSEADCARVIGDVCDRPRESHKEGPDGSRARENLFGKSICFTGEFQHELDGERVSRDSLEGLVTRLGMFVHKSVTKKLDYLVVADPDSMSLKAKKAREYGLRIIAEPAFWKLVEDR